MKNIVKQFPPPQNIIQKEYSSHPQKIFDLHGYTSDEVRNKIPWILEYAIDKHYNRIRIVTGVGKGILFSTAKNMLSKEKEKKTIIDFTLSAGVIEVYF